MIDAADDQMFYVAGCDDTGWSWKRVDAAGITVAEGKSSLAEEAVQAAYALAKQPDFITRYSSLTR